MAVFDRLVSERPELLALAIFVIAFATVRSVTKRLTLKRLLAGAAFFLAFTYFLFQARQVPYLSSLPAKDALSRFIGDGVKTIWWFWGAAMASEALRIYAARGSTPLARYRLAQDLSVGGIYLCALIGFTTFVLNLPLQGLLVTSGAVAVILGLALQSALGDAFYGIVLSLGKPYSIGDWITLDNGTEGTVVEVNWRATHLLTDRRDVAIVPNSLIAKARIVNASFPSRTHGTTIRLPLAASVSPELAVQVLSDAALACRKVLLNPPATAVVKSMSREATIFEVTFFTSELALASAARTAVYEKIFRALGAAGIPLGSNESSSAAEEKFVLVRGKSDVERLVEFTPAFRHATAEERSAIADSLIRENFDAGETVLKQGTVPSALYIVGSGVLSWARDTGEIERLGATDYFGAEDLLTDATVRGRISAVTRASVYRLEKQVLLKLLQGRRSFSDDAGGEPASDRSAA